MHTNILRRSFLKTGGALVVGFSCSAANSAAPAAAGLPGPKSVAKDVVESFLEIGKDGGITVYVGKVDLGTGTKTALAQIAADELDVPFERITMVMGDTATTPDQWITGANLTISQGGLELRRACATARGALIASAAQKFGVAAADLDTADGKVRVTADPARATAYAGLIGDETLALKIDPKVVTKKHADYRVVGKSIPRVDIPAKVTGEFTYVHDFRLPGMLHARVVRADDQGAKLLSFDDSAARQVKGYVRCDRGFSRHSPGHRILTAMPGTA